MNEIEQPAIKVLPACLRYEEEEDEYKTYI